MISATKMPNLNNSCGHHGRSNSPEFSSKSFADPTEELLCETVFSRWSSQKTPAFPLPLNSTSPKFPTRQASTGYQDSQQSVSPIEGASSESVAPAIPPHIPLRLHGALSNRPTRSKKKRLNSKISGKGKDCS